MKRIWVVTMFPEYFEPLRECGVVGKALRSERGSGFELNVLKLSDFSSKGFKGIDDSPYGGGHGMVMRADVLENALKSIKETSKDIHVVFTSPRGVQWNQSVCEDFAKKLTTEFKKDIVFICGRYEGIDERFIEQYVDEIFSIGDFIISGGEIAVLTLIDSAMRFCTDVLGNVNSAVDESFAHGLLEHPYYTRPLEFNGSKVPEVLVNGHHEKAQKWKEEKRLELTKKHRLDLYEKWVGDKDA